MADKSFGIKQIDLVGTGTPTIQSANNLNLNATNTTISGDLTVSGNTIGIGTIPVNGASTISEILAVGINSILIPFPYAVDAHQEFNARFLADKGACHLVLEKDCKLDSFVELVKRVGFSEPVRQRIISVTSLMAKPGSASLIVKSCMELFNA